MTCYYPLTGYRAKKMSQNGKYPVVFNRKDGFVDKPVTVPCGRCIGCRLEKSRQWAIRCVHEASLHKKNSFLTLTYRNEDLPENSELRLEDYQKFIKRLRKRKGRIRYIGCGEYGGRFSRPHYHLIIFGWEPENKVFHRMLESGFPAYKASELDNWDGKTKNPLWRYGFVQVGDVTFESAAYIARYTLKKQVDLDQLNDELRKKSFITMSKNPPIADEWIKKYLKQTLENDEIVINKKKVKPPKYYDKIMEESEPDAYRSLSYKREAWLEKNKKDLEYWRLRTREQIQLSRAKKLKRGLENGIDDLHDTRR